MAGVGALISSLLSSVAKLLPEVKNFVFAPSASSSTQSAHARSIEDELNKLMRTLKRIKATLYDAEEREIIDRSVKLWLKELKEMGRAAEYVIDECMYEVYRARVEAGNTSELNPRKMKQGKGSAVLLGVHSIRVPYEIVDRIREIRSRFDEIAKDREALRLPVEDGVRRDEGVRLRAPSSHLILEPIVFGREREMEKVIDFMFSNIHEGVITVVPIVGMGGLGKTTLARLIYNEWRVKQKFNLFGWTCVSDNFTVERLTQDLIESFTGNSCSLKNLSALHDTIKNVVAGKNVFIVLDDIWNENKDLWELFCAPFKSAVKVVFVVTTRSNGVAKIMQTTSPFRLGYLTEEESWLFFQQCAFGDIDHNVDTNLLDIGKKISKKCGGLPLAIKSISNLLRHENEESWVEILENDLWEMHAENDIFGALQISYTRMPPYLRSCFLLCSLFPKDYEYDVDELVEIWIAEGYIESKTSRTLEEVAFQYALELRDRSFVDPIYGDTQWNKFKIHDLVHDLARQNSENEMYLVERGIQPNPPEEVLHMYVDDHKQSSSFWMEDYKKLLKSLNLNDVTRLRTFLVDTTSALIDFTEAKSLRVLRLNYKSLHNFGRRFGRRYRPVNCCGYSVFSLYHLEKLDLNLAYGSIDLEMLGNLVNLKFLRLWGCCVERIPESLCFLTNLRSLSIQNIKMSILPENIGNLSQLQKLIIFDCRKLSFLLESLYKLSGLKTLSLTHCKKIIKLSDDIGNLTNLQNLIIKGTGIDYLPRSFSKLNAFRRLTLNICLRLDALSNTINWLKKFNILRGALTIAKLGCIPSLENARNFNLISKPNLKKLALSWGQFDSLDGDNNLRLELGTTDDDVSEEVENTNETLDEHVSFRVLENTKYKDMNVHALNCIQPPKYEDMDLHVFKSLQPHPNLEYLCICRYKNPVFPGWVGDPSSCASLEKICIAFCGNIMYLPFGNLKSLKQIEIQSCPALQTISRDSLPSQLQRLDIAFCSSLVSVTGLEDLELLDRLVIRQCENLKYFSFDLISEERCQKSSLSRLKKFSPPKKVNLGGCPNLHLLENEVVPCAHWNIEIYGCEGLKQWCLRHNIGYDVSWNHS